jgi:hypothetical protein
MRDVVHYLGIEAWSDLSSHSQLVADGSTTTESSPPYLPRTLEPCVNTSDGQGRSATPVDLGHATREKAAASGEEGGAASRVSAGRTEGCYFYTA